MCAPPTSHQMARNERFPSSFQFHIQTLVQTLTPHITQKSKEAPSETKCANISLANFVKVSGRVCVFCFVVVSCHSNSILVRYHGGDMMYEMRRSKPEPTLLLTQGIFNLQHRIGMV